MSLYDICHAVTACALYLLHETCSFSIPNDHNNELPSARSHVLHGHPIALQTGNNSPDIKLDETKAKPFSHARRKSFSSRVVSSFTSLTSFKARNLSGEEASVPWYRAAITTESEYGKTLMCIPLETDDHYTRNPVICDDMRRMLL